MRNKVLKQHTRKLEDLENTASKLRSHIQAMELSKNEQRTLDELRSKEYNIRLHGIIQNSTMETTDQLGSTVRTFIVDDKLRFVQDHMNEMQFCNIHRLTERAIQSTPDISSVCSRLIVMKLARITVKMTLLKLAQDARQHNVNITRHLPRSMQKQRASLLKSPSRLHKAGRRFCGKLNLPTIAYMPMTSECPRNMRILTSCQM